MNKGSILLLVRELRIEHTLFALPFAYVGAVLAARGFPTLHQFIWITLAVLGARSAAMSANRYFDRELDARNPRTARRALPAGTLPPRVMVAAGAGGLILLLVAAFELNPVCVALYPLALLGIALYPFCKRFTWGTHFVLGAVDGFAPLGAYIGVAGTISLPAILMFAAVTSWVAGFDIIYALMDRDVDLAQGLRSIPARFGKASGRRVPIALHLAMLVLLALAGWLAQVGPVYYAGVALAAILVWYEDRLFNFSKNIFVLNERVFVSNMSFSVAFLATTVGGFFWRL